MQPYIAPLIPTPPPVWMTVSDIDGIGSFFVFMDAAIRCYPLVLVLSCIGGFLFISLLFYIMNRNKAVI